MSRSTRSSTRPKKTTESPRSQRRQAGVSYKEPDTDEEDHEDDFVEESPRSSSTPRPRRNPVRRPSTRQNQLPATPLKKPRRKPRSRGSSTSSADRQVLWQDSATSSQTTVFKGSFSKDVTDLDGLEAKNDGPVLPWTKLEFDILRDIFHYGADLSARDTNQDPDKWLNGVARTCKAFTEPALSAMYRNPPLNTVERVNAFMAATKNADGSVNLHGKNIKHLEIEAIPVLTKNIGNQGSILIQDILASAPNIKTLAIEAFGTDQVSNAKRKGIEQATKGRKIVYQSELIDVLEKNNTTLKTIKWCYFFNQNKSYPWQEMSDVHSRRPFRYLENLEITWLNYFTSEKHKTAQIESLVQSTAHLPRLKTVALTYSSLYHRDVSLLEGLPRNLEGISFTDCEDLTSDVLSGFLVTHGYNLRRLVLKYNRNLNLGFIGILGTACPNLEVFKIDIHCFGLRVTTTDYEPTFNKLLPDEVVPTWPAKLQDIEMVCLRKWNSEAAGIFFKSLADSAQNLQDLRSLIINASVDQDWRDRVQFRDKWYATLKHVFLKVSKPPTSIRTITKPIMNAVDGEMAPESSGNRKRKAADIEHDQPIGRRLRRRSSGGSPSKNIETETTESSHQLSEADTKLLHIQGMCTTVDIRIDNLRPGETMFTEQDFMDQELSGDEDWNGQDSYDSGLGATYAW